MNRAHQLGIIGCGDFLRWQADSIKKSKRIAVRALFDTDRGRAQKYAGQLGGRVADSAEGIFADPAIDVVALFVPPWVRRGLIAQAAKAGKQIITTKPLGPNTADCRAMVAAVKKARVRCGVFYRRTGNAGIELYKQIFDSGKFGKLALYKQDWIHHYPAWNTWALDPKKNGGPFMDAMIHNLNIARYLMGARPTAATFFSQSHAHRLPCADTEFMKIDFGPRRSAHLFITWAADLAVYSTAGNDREHVDITYMVTDRGWRLTEGWENGKFTVTASKDGKQEKFTAPVLPRTPYDEFVRAVEARDRFGGGVVDIVEAAQDIQILGQVGRKTGRQTHLRLD
jgi:predicted dehydrogenase